MKKIWAIVFLSLGLTACQDSKKAENADNEKNEPTQLKEKMQPKIEDEVVFKQDYVVAPEMQNFPIYEIGQLIKNLMLDEMQTQYDWNHLANDEYIQWTTSSYDEQFNAHTNSTITSREGLVRIHVQGERIAILRDRHYEAPWQISYYGTQAKWGVSSIDIIPTGDFQTFPDPLRSLQQQNIDAQKVCEQRYAGERTAVYVLKAKNKKDMFLIDQMSAGSAGSSRWLTLEMQDKSTEWCSDEAERIQPEI